MLADRKRAPGGGRKKLPPSERLVRLPLYVSPRVAEMFKSRAARQWLVKTIDEMCDTLDPDEFSDLEE